MVRRSIEIARVKIELYAVELKLPFVEFELLAVCQARLRPAPKWRSRGPHQILANPFRRSD